MKRMLAMFLGICLLASGCSGGGSEEAHCVGKGDDDSGGDRPAWDQPEFLL